MKYIVATILILCFASVGYGSITSEDMAKEVTDAIWTARETHQKEHDGFKEWGESTKERYERIEKVNKLEQQLSDLQLEVAELRFSIEALKDGYRSKHPLVKDKQSK